MSTLERIQAGLEGIEFEVRDAADQVVTLVAPRTAIPELMGRLKERCGFETSTLVTAVDHLPAEPRFEMAWQFLSVRHADRVRVRAFVPGDDPRVPTITHLWPGAAYSERECYDLFGIVFEGHEGLKRLLMPEAYEHFPLRKDFPQQGIEPSKLYDQWDKNRRLPKPEES